jgi:Uma2 family endonuclease
MSALPNLKFTPEEYLAIERKAEFKSEYYQGEMFALAGATKEHITIAGNLSGLFFNELRGRPCQAFLLDMRVKVEETSLYTYPDLAIACEDMNFEDSELDILTNPVVLIEILSKSTEAYDRGKKIRTLPQTQFAQGIRPHRTGQAACGNL